MPRAKYKKRKDGRYATSIQVGYKDNGKPKLKTIYAYSIPELERKKAEAIMLRDKGIVVDDRSLTVGAWADQWYSTYKVGKSDGTKAMYENIIKNHIKPNIGFIQLKKLRSHHVQKVINQLYDDGYTRTITLFVMTVNEMVKQAIHNDLIFKDVTDNLEIPALPTPQKRALTKEEENALKKVDFTLKQKTFVNLLRYTGIRRGEALGLMQSDIDLEEMKLSVNRQVAFDKKGWPYLTDPKWKSFRTIDIPDILKSTLEEYLKNIDMYLFTKQDGKLHTKSSFRGFWNSIVRRINIAAGGHAGSRSRKKLVVIHGLTPHIFRHNFATMLYYADVDILMARDILGHKDERTTLRTYTHLDKEKSDSITKLNKYLAELI